MFVVALVMACAFGAVAAYSAFALPTILPETVVSFAIKSHPMEEPKLVVTKGGAELVCKEAKGLEIGIAANRNLGEFHLHFTRCFLPVVNSKCTGLGEEEGVVLTFGTWHLVWDTLGTGAELHVAMLFLLEAIHFTCKPPIGAEQLFEVLPGGMVLCLILNASSLTKEFEFHCSENGSKEPADTKYYNASGTLVNITRVKIVEDEGETKQEAIQLWTGIMEFSSTATILLMI